MRNFLLGFIAGMIFGIGVMMTFNADAGVFGSRVKVYEDSNGVQYLLCEYTNGSSCSVTMSPRYDVEGKICVSK